MHTETSAPVQLASRLPQTFFGTPFVPNPCEHSLYRGLRAAVPLIDAALSKIVRLTGGYRVVCENEADQPMLDRFCETVPVGLTGQSLQTFTDSYLDSLLTFGNAVGEIILNRDTLTVEGLYNGDVTEISVAAAHSPTARNYYRTEGGEQILLPNPELIVFSALAPPAGKIYGTSVLQGLPALSEILLRIYECIGQNYDRAGNVRYAVTYHPEADGAFSRERAQEIAAAWQQGMTAAQYGEVRDFVAVGDVDIKVIGAENQLSDTNVPVRQLLEQLLAKLSIPPFLLGLSWATTERMSAQQADILTSELEYYRRQLTPVILKITETFMRLSGKPCQLRVEWEHINLQDETALADARLKNAQARALELQNNKEEEKNV